MAANQGNSRAMAKTLSFAWNVKERGRTRMFLAIVLATVIFILGGLYLRIVVPVSIAVDGRRLSGIELVSLEDGDPIVRRLYEETMRPSLSLERNDDSVPLLDDLFAQLGLSDDESEEIRLHPPIDLTPELQWPEASVEQKLSLPALPTSAPRPEVTYQRSNWVVELRGKGAEKERFPVKALPWNGELPIDREREMLAVLDEEGKTVMASLLGERDDELEVAVRQVWEHWLAENSVQGGFAGILQLEFKKAEE